MASELDAVAAGNAAALAELAELRAREEAAEAVVVAARAAYRCDGGHKYADALASLWGAVRRYDARTAPGASLSPCGCDAGYGPCKHSTAPGAAKGGGA